MKYLSRNDLETIGGRVIAAYKRLPAISGQALERVDIDHLCQELLGLRIDYARLSLNGEKIGLTSSCDIGVEVFPEDPSSTEEQYYISEIGRELKSRNIPTKAGKESWHPYRIAYMLKNERYIGDSFYQKTYRETTVPFNQHINRGQEDRFYAKGTHPGIIDKDVFNAVQQLIQKRKETFSRTTTQNIYPLTSRIQCSECGSFYRRRSVSGTVKWVCALHKDDSTACDSHYYSEERIYDGFITMVNKLRFSEDNILGQVISRLEMTLAAMKRNNLVARDLSNSIAELNAKLLMLEQLRSKGYLAPEVYQAQANEIGAELARLKDVRQEKFNSKAASMLEEVKKLKMLIFELEEPLEAFDEKLFLEIVKSIQINKEDEMSVEFLGGLRFRERI